MNRDPNQTSTGLNLSFEDPADQALWEDLGQLPNQTPSDQLRANFHAQLANRAIKPNPWTRFKAWFGPMHWPQWVAAPAILVLGLSLGMRVNPTSPTADQPALAGQQIEQMQQQLNDLNRLVAMSMMDDALPHDRLKGIQTAVSLLGDDTMPAQQSIANALLKRATGDQNPQVQAAAFDALAPKLQTEEVSSALFDALINTDSALLQVELVDLVLRWGSDDQIKDLLSLIEGQNLLPSTTQYTLNRIQPETT